MAAIAKRCGVEAPGPTARCGGVRAGTSCTWSSASAARAARPAAMCPSCTGSKVPPRRPRRAGISDRHPRTRCRRRPTPGAAPPRGPPRRAARRLRAARSTPVPAAAEIARQGSPSAAARACSRASRSGSSSASILLAATSCGLSRSAGSKSYSSRRTCRDPPPDRGPRRPTRRRRARARRCVRRGAGTDGRGRGRVCAPSISPGTSATTNVRSSLSWTTPRFGRERGERIVGDLGPGGAGTRG